MTRKKDTDDADARESEPDTTPNTDPAPVEENEDGEEVCSVCGRKGRPPGHH